MKMYSYTVNTPKSTGKYYITANTKKEAIELADKIWGYGGANKSSFRVCEKGVISND